MRTIPVIIMIVACLAGFSALAAGGTTDDGTDITFITLQGNSISLKGSGAVVNGSIATITAAGTYSIKGTLDNGQIRVDTADTGTVTLILNGASVTCASSAPVYVINADKVVINLAEGTRNSMTDGSSYTNPDEPNAAIFSNDDLTIKGSGSLSVDANFNDAITSQDDLKITGGSITVDSVNDGIRGRDSVEIKGGTLKINSAGDGIQSSNDEEPDKGTVSIEDGTISIVAGADGIQAATSLSISGGQITVKSGSGSTDADSTKGLKAGVALAVTGGTLDITSSDDALHSNGAVSIGGGTLTLASGDDGIHAETTLVVDAGKITITKCYEGLEAADITINGGDIRLTASDDGVNGSDGTGGDTMAAPPAQISGQPANMATPPGPANAQPGGLRNQSGTMNGQPAAPAGQNWQDPTGATGSNTLTINGGYLAVYAGGDGLDVNGPITMTGGTVIVNGPTDNGNGAMDYTGSCTVSGGTLVLSGSQGMAMAPSAGSSQYSVMLTYGSVQKANTMVHVQTAAGTTVLSFVPAKNYQSVVFSSPDLAAGTSYAVYSGGSGTGTATDGLYTGGAYKGGTKVANFTISNKVTTISIGNTPTQGVSNATIQGNKNTPYPGYSIGLRNTTSITAIRTVLYSSTTSSGIANRTGTLSGLRSTPAYTVKSGAPLYSTYRASYPGTAGTVSTSAGFAATPTDPLPGGMGTTSPPSQGGPTPPNSPVTGRPGNIIPP